MKPATLGLKSTGLFIFVIICNSKIVRRGVSILKLISG